MINNMEDFLAKAKEWLGDNFGKLLEKIKEYAKKAGRVAAKPCLQLYYVLMKDDVPRGDKAIIVAALVYTVIPRDLIPFGRWGLLGWVDDAISVAVVVKKMRKYLTPEIDVQVENTLNKWFQEYTEFEQV